MKLSNLSDGYIKFPAKKFYAGKLVNGRILSLDTNSKPVRVCIVNNPITQREKKTTLSLSLSLSLTHTQPRVEMSLRKTALRTQLFFSDLKEGDKKSGKVKSVKPYGVFVSLDSTSFYLQCVREPTTFSPSPSPSLP